jgi:hypothetical protein
MRICTFSSTFVQTIVLHATAVIFEDLSAVVESPRTTAAGRTAKVNWKRKTIENLFERGSIFAGSPEKQHANTINIIKRDFILQLVATFFAQKPKNSRKCRISSCLIEKNN